MKNKLIALLSTSLVTFTFVEAQTTQKVVDSISPKATVEVPKINLQQEVFFDQTEGETSIPEEMKEIELNPSKVTIKGADNFPNKELLQSELNKVSGKKITLYDIFVLSQKVTKIYRDSGYILTTVVVPAQEIDPAGEVKLQAIEGRIGNYEIVGEKDEATPVLIGMIKNIIASVPLKYETLEEYSLKINDLYGVKARFSFKPGKENGTSDLVVDLKRKNLSGKFGVNNFGSRKTANRRHETALRYANGLGLEEQISLTYNGTLNNPLENNEYSADYSQIVNSNGDKFQISQGHSLTKPGGTSKPLNIKSTSDLTSVVYTVNPIRTRSYSQYFSLGYDGVSSLTTLEEGNRRRKHSEDRLQSLTLRSNSVIIDNYGGSVVDLSAKKGLGLSKVSAKPGSPERLGSKRDGEEEAFLMRGSLARETILPVQGFSLFSLANSQYAFNSVLGPDEYSFGGRTLGRGYQPGEISGDSGFGGSLELRYNQNLYNPYVNAMLLYTFVDSGVAKERTTRDGTKHKTTESITSAGSGVRFDVLTNGSFNLLWTRPLTKSVSAYGHKKSSHYFAEFAINF